MTLKWLLIGMLWLVTACQAESDAASTERLNERLQTDVTPTLALVTPILTPTPDITPLPTSAPSSVVSLWFPEPLAPLDNVDAAELLSQQISAFQTGGLSVDFRLKTVDPEGGIMATLRAASAVAPGAVPHVTLLRRADLSAAADAGLIVPLSDNSLSSVLNNFAPMVRALGRVDGVLYGLPYTIEVQHLAYSGERLNTADFDSVLADELTLVFPAGATNTVSDVLLAQYREAADLLDDPLLTIEPDPLRAVFSFYEGAVDAGLIDTTVLEYASPEEYADQLVSGDMAGVVTSSLYLDLLDSGAELNYAPIPTLSGAGATVVDGWMWVITTPDGAEGANALRFILSMMDAERQGAYHRSIHMLPSQEGAQTAILDPDYAEFVARLLQQGTLPLVDPDSALTARALTSAFAAVLAGRESAAAAVNEVERQLAAP